MSAGVPLETVLGLLQYLMCTAVILTAKNTVLGTFVDDTVKMATNVVQENATRRLQVAFA